MAKSHYQFKKRQKELAKKKKKEEKRQRKQGGKTDGNDVDIQQENGETVSPAAWDARG